MLFSFVCKCKYCKKAIHIDRSMNDTHEIICPLCGQAAEYRDMGHIQHLMDTIQTASDRNGLLEIQEIKVYDF